jgi:hypothetical protein
MMKKINRISLLIGIVLPALLFSQNTNISNGIVFDGEPYLAINPNNSQHMVVAWMGFKLNQHLVIKTKRALMEVKLGVLLILHYTLILTLDQQTHLWLLMERETFFYVILIMTI